MRQCQQKGALALGLSLRWSCVFLLAWPRFAGRRLRQEQEPSGRGVRMALEDVPTEDLDALRRAARYLAAPELEPVPPGSG